MLIDSFDSCRISIEYQMVIFFYSGIFGNVIQILQISIKLKEPRKGMLITEAMDEGEASKI